MRVRLFLPFMLLLLVGFAEPDPSFTEVCPGVPIQIRTPDYTPGGIILTAFDKSGIWIYNIDRDSRYPLPDTRPCNRNCRLSPDARWITYVDPRTGAYGKMRLDGTERMLLNDYAHDIDWWPDNRLLIWTPGHQAYWQAETGDSRTFLDVEGITSVQPGGHWGLYIEQDGDGFTRSLLDLDTRDLQGIAGQQIPLGEDVPYFDATSWSPDGTQFAYVAPGTFDDRVGIAGAELFLLHLDEPQPIQLTDLNRIYGAVRINGGVRGDLSWSPDSTQIAFWVIELLGPDYEGSTGNAILHVVNTTTGVLRAYCGFTTTEHTPDPPRLQWSPDGTHIAFGGNIPADDKGYLLLALDTASGIFTQLSDGIFPVIGAADVIAWGLPPP
ncbi:MAG: hypothetical protein K8J31_00965 [Anaerolineae bacterium]|nr:hypothetical protein [Anaerolineae bacterium]